MLKLNVRCPVCNCFTTAKHIERQSGSYTVYHHICGRCDTNFEFYDSRNKGFTVISHNGNGI